MTEIANPFIYIADPTKSRALFNASLFFGLPDTDPTIASNQKLVKGIQEDGNEVSLAQPVTTNAGGVPQYNGTSVRLSIDGDYSFIAWNSKNVETYNASSVSNPEDGSNGFSGVVAVEPVILSASQTTIVLDNLGANESVFYLQTNFGDQGFLAKDIDYTVTNSTTIELASSYNAGDVIVARQNDPTGQLIPIIEDAEALLVFQALSNAQTSAAAGDLVAGDTITLNGNAATGDGLGGDKYTVIVTAFGNDGVNYLDLNGTLQLELQNNYYRFQNYSEKKATAGISAGTLNIDLDAGPVHEITLTESASNVVFINFNPDSNYSSNITLKVTQDGVGGWGITWPASIIWSGGVAPTVTVAAAAIDLFGFATFDAGVTWFGFPMGDNFS